jgi:hypothetical protein
MFPCYLLAFDRICLEWRKYHGDRHDGGVWDEDCAVHISSTAELCDVEFGHVEALEFVQAWFQSV